MSKENFPGWKSGSSIALELDVALAAVRDYTAGARMPADFARLLRSIPESWRAEFPEVIKGSHGFGSFLEVPALLAGVLHESDYGRATLAIRDLTIEKALTSLEAEAARVGVKADLALDPAERLVDLGVRARIELLRSAGIEANPDSFAVLTAKHEYERAAAVLSGAAQHSSFWYWVDRFYFQLYHDWRESRLEQVEKERASLLEGLGALEKEGQAPALDWLPQQNPLRVMPGLREAVQSGRLEVFFWMEPFGLTDFMALHPSGLAISFAEHGPIYQNFEEEATNLAERVKALADPTRLIILRIIRHFGMVNTDMAAYLGLSRPTVSIHAKILRDAGLIRSVQVGREVRHEIVPGELRRLFQDLERLLDVEEDLSHSPSPAKKHAGER